MAFAAVASYALNGVEVVPVNVEVHTAGGLPGMSIVGLPQSAVRESKDRVRAAIENSGIRFPQSRIVVNLAPADLPKRGGGFDLPIALGVLVAMGYLTVDAIANRLFIGELGLNGELRAVRGVLPAACAYAKSPISLFVPRSNALEASLSGHASVCAVDRLSELVHSLQAGARAGLPVYDVVANKMANDNAGAGWLDMCDVQGQIHARRALELAAAGMHHLMLSGPPGTGKSMLASRLPSILPPMTDDECVQVATIASISQSGFCEDCWGWRPFRAPHHTATGIALVGGGSIPAPGEISMAHHGVLFLDELPEFSRSVIDVLREPMEAGSITISRGTRRATFPARFQLVAAMNPCPCGYFGDPSTPCRCGYEQIQRYRRRVSGPFLDRIDLHVSLHREAECANFFASNAVGEHSSVIRNRAVAARARQIDRQGMANAELSVDALRRVADLSVMAKKLLSKASLAMDLSLRAQHRLLRVALTAADLDGEEQVDESHLAECLSYRHAPIDV